jgi:hypothetical protein
MCKRCLQNGWSLRIVEPLHYYLVGLLFLILSIHIGLSFWSDVRLFSADGLRIEILIAFFIMIITDSFPVYFYSTRKNEVFTSLGGASLIARCLIVLGLIIYIAFYFLSLRGDTKIFISQLIIYMVKLKMFQTVGEFFIFTMYSILLSIPIFFAIHIICEPFARIATQYKSRNNFVYIRNNRSVVWRDHLGKITSVSVKKIVKISYCCKIKKSIKIKDVSDDDNYFTTNEKEVIFIGTSDQKILKIRIDKLLMTQFFDIILTGLETATRIKSDDLTLKLINDLEIRQKHKQIK